MRWDRSDLYFNGYTASAFFKAFSDSGSVVFHSKSGFTDRLNNLLQNYHRIQPNRDLMIHGGLTELLSWLLTKKNDSTPTETEEMIYHLIQYLQAHYSEPINMDDISNLTGFSKYHLSREFRRLTGYAPIEYLLMVRMENVGTLLRNTDLSIAQIAERCGINSEQYLCRQFQKHFSVYGWSIDGESRIAVLVINVHPALVLVNLHVPPQGDVLEVLEDGYLRANQGFVTGFEFLVDFCPDLLQGHFLASTEAFVDYNLANR